MQEVSESAECVDLRGGDRDGDIVHIRDRHIDQHRQACVFQVSRK